ncbi:MAG TPA: response regulator [Solirubrobacteraceae bacterium]|nr:response regulator [Solirubrobacteraceae bacterium]
MARTVLIVDDHAAFRARARRALELDGYEVVGEAADGAGGIAEAARLHPSVVLLDVGLPDASGFDVAARIAGAGTDVVLTSTREYDALEAGSAAAGFVPKAELSGAALDAALAER